MSCAVVALFAAGLAGCDKAAPPSMGDASPQRTAATPSPPTTAPSGSGSTTSLPPNAGPPATGPAAPDAPTDPTVASFLGLTAPKPAEWQWRPPDSAMRAANYTVPGPGGPAELIVFYFGPNMGGSKEANISRWAGQFRSADGGAVEPILEDIVVDEMGVTTVELVGDYRGMTDTFESDQTFLAAIVDAHVGNVYIRFVGPTETIEQNREAFMTMIKGLKQDLEF